MLLNTFFDAEKAGWTIDYDESGGALCLRWGGPSGDAQEPPTVSAYLLRRDLGGLKFPPEASFERLLFHTDANWPVDVEERVAPRSGILFGPAAWAEIACSS